jgi:uncharacterized protein
MIASKKHFLIAVVIAAMALMLLPAHTVSGQPVNLNSGTSDSTLTMIPARWEKIPLERPYNWVNDFENSLTVSQEKHLDSLLTALYKKTTIEMFLVTVDTAVSNKEMFGDLGLHILKNWYATADSNSWGGLVLISKSLKKIKILSNENLEQFISEEEMKAVVEQGFMPGYMAGDFYRGTREGTVKLTVTLRKNYKKWSDANEQKPQPK